MMNDEVISSYVYRKSSILTEGIHIVSLIMYLGLLAITIYIIILIIKLARRGIKALDIYISKNHNKL